MTDIAVRDTDSDQYAVAPTATVRALAEYATELEAAGRLAKALAATNFVPDCFRGKPDEAAACILTGHELGFPPTAALRAFYPAPGGRMEMYARAMQAVALSHGHDIWPEAMSDERVVICGHVKGTPADRVLRVEWTPERVRKAGLLKERGNHEKIPQQMMTSRGIAEMARLVAPAELHGIYCPEERDDVITVEATVGPSTPAMSGADIIAQAATQPPAQPVDVPEPERVEPKPSDAALRRMFSLMNSKGLGGKDRRELALAWISDTIGHEIASRDELTAAEVKHVCEVLEQLGEAETPAEQSA